MNNNDKLTALIDDVYRRAETACFASNMLYDYLRHNRDALGQETVTEALASMRGAFSELIAAMGSLLGPNFHDDYKREVGIEAEAEYFRLLVERNDRLGDDLLAALDSGLAVDDLDIEGA
jgi:hypothetical protein